MKSGYPIGILVNFLLCLSSIGVKGQVFILNGSASSLGGDCYQLTPDVGGQAGSIFSQNTIDLTQAFNLDATLFFGCKDGNGADGIVFILATSNTALGNGGGGIGYEGITPSIAVEYDDYFNSGYNDPVPDHMAVTSNGVMNHSGSTNLSGPINLTNIENCMDHCFAISWDPDSLILTATLDGDTISYSGDIVANIFSGNSQVYYGFSAGTGSLSNIHRVCFGPPPIDAMPDVNICEGESIELQADPDGIAWTWVPDPSLTPLNVSNPTATPDITATYTVSIEYACGYFGYDTVMVTVIPAPFASASNNGPVCEGESLSLMSSGGISYHWSGPSGYSSSSQNPVINNINAGMAGIYFVTVTDAGGCTNTAETEVELFPIPSVSIDSIIGSLCENGEAVQLVGTPAGGTWTGEVSPTGVFDPAAAGEGLYTITYTITDGNGCTNEDEIVIKVVPNIPAEIMPEGPFCSEDTVITLTANPPGGTWGEAADSDGQIYPGTLSPGLHLVTYELTGEDECYNTEIYIEIVVSPTVSCSNGPQLCFNSPPVMLNATPPGGTWSGAANAAGIVDPMTLGPGLHMAVYTDTSVPFGCTGNSCWTYVEVFDAPQITNISFICDSISPFYVVTFSILGGDTSSYTVTSSTNGTLLSGSPYSFMSNPIPSGDIYSFLVDDIHHCSPDSIGGSHDCSCITNAGFFNSTPLILCEDSAIVLTLPIGINLDSDDTLFYILHTGDPDSIIRLLDTNYFVRFEPPLQYGITYFISAVVGNAIPGGIDFDDPCLSISNGIPITWIAKPSGYISGPTMICTGDSALLTFHLTGDGPFDVVWADNFLLSPLNSIDSGYTVVVHPTSNTTYGIISITSLADPVCSNFLVSTFQVLVDDVIQLQQVLMICEGDSLFLGGTFQKNQGIYYDTIPGTIGCDTVLESNLILNPLDTTYLNGASCDINQVGIFENLYSNRFGCDSTVISIITFIDTDTTQLSSSTCDPQSAGVFTQTFIAQSGCDSVVIETISLLQSDTIHLTSGNCDIAATGIFSQTLTNGNGCDSIIIETVIHLPSDTTSLFGNSCLPADTGTTNIVLQNVFGCDSLVIESISLISSWLTSDTSTTCDVAATGTFTSQFVSSQGCDSTVISVVNLLPSDTITLFSSSCDPADTGTIVLIFTNEFGCDSMVQTLTALAPADSCIIITHEVYVPSVFSPNEDGINDHFLVFAPQGSVTKISYLRIFDRWGGLVLERHDFQPNDPDYGWDGTELGKPVSPGVFVWMVGIEYKDGSTEARIGDVTLIR